MVEGTGYRNGSACVFPFEDLYIGYRQKLIHFFMARGLERDHAEDLSQEAFFRFLRSDRPLESEEHARNSLFCIAQNLLIDFFRKHNGSVRVGAFARDDLLKDRDPYLVAEEADPEESLISYETSRDVLSALSRLPAHYAQVILLKEYEGLSYREIAARMGVSEKSVESLLYRARSQLKEDLVEMGRKRGGWWSGVAAGLRAIGDRARGRPWRTLHRVGRGWKSIPAGIGASGAGSCALNLVVAILLLGSVVGGGVAAVASACVRPPDAMSGAKDAAVVSASAVDGNGEVAGRIARPTRCRGIPSAQGGSIAMTAEEEGAAALALVPQTTGLADGLLSKTGEAVRGLIVTAGNGLDGLLAGLGYVLRGLSDPLAGMLFYAGMPRDLLGALLEAVDMEEARVLASRVVNAAVDVTCAGEETLASLDGLACVENVAEALAPSFPAEDGKGGEAGEGTDTREGEYGVGPASPASSEEVLEQAADTAPEESQADGDQPIGGAVDETLDLLEGITGGVLDLLLPL